MDADDEVNLDAALLEGGADERDGAGWTLLHHAACRGASDGVVSRLLREAKLVNAVSASGPARAAAAASTDDVRAWRGLTPVHLAAAGGHTRLLPLLAGAGADMDARREGGYTPLMDAVERTRGLQLINALLAAGARADVPLDGRPRTPLQIACNMDLVELLLRAGARCNVYSARGRTALHAAAAGGHAGICVLLLRAGADANALCGPERRPALDYAVMSPAPSPAVLAVLRPLSPLANVATCLARALKRACAAPEDAASGLEGAALHLLLGPAAGGDGLLPAHMLAPLLAPVADARAGLEVQIAAQERAVARIGSWDEKKATVAAVAVGIVLVGVVAAIASSSSSSSSSSQSSSSSSDCHRHHHSSSGGGYIADAYAGNSSERLRRQEAEGELLRLQQRYARVTRLHDALQAAYAAALAALPSPPAVAARPAPSAPQGEPLTSYFV